MSLHRIADKGSDVLTLSRAKPKDGELIYIKILTVMVVEIPLEMCCSLEKGICSFKKLVVWR